MGYTPLFDTLLSGTLYGRWPHTGVWACLLSRVSREGVIDETPQCLAAAIGIDIHTLSTCIADFMKPDPDSRTAECDGRRLELIDPQRSWGWRVINHAKYKEKARKRNYDQQRTESGADAERKRLERANGHDVPRSPDASRAVPLSSPSPSPSPSPTPVLKSETRTKNATDVAGRNSDSEPEPEVVVGSDQDQEADVQRDPESQPDPKPWAGYRKNGKQSGPSDDRRAEAKRLWPRVLAAIQFTDLQKSFPADGEIQRAVNSIGGWQQLGNKPRHMRGQTEQAFLNAYASLATSEVA